MKKNILTLTALIAMPMASCSFNEPIDFTSPATLASPLQIQPAADYRSATWGSETLTRTEARSYPLIDSWVFSRSGEDPKRFTRNLQIERFKKVNADEIFAQMQGAVQGRTQTHAATRTICYENNPESSPVREASFWRYSDTSSAKPQTYATGVTYRFASGPAFETFMRNEFTGICNAMRNQTVFTPPALS